MLKLGWFSTGRGPGSRNLLTTVNDAISRGYIDARIEFVFSNREYGEAEGSDQFQDLVRSLGLDLACLSFRRFKRERPGDQWRNRYDREVIAKLAGFHPDLCVLAGYMLILSPELCNHYTCINLHPAAPGAPEGTWQEVIWKLIDQRAAHSGIRIHLVTEELDQGPIVTYCTYPIIGPRFDNLWAGVEGRSAEVIQAKEGEELPLFKAIREEGAKRELPLLVETIRSVADGTIDLTSNAAIRPLDLTQSIEASLG